MRVDLSDGSSFFLAERDGESEGLSEGETLDDERFERLTLFAEAFAARAKALDLLALSEQPRARLEMKLRARGYAPASIVLALDHLQHIGAVDDLRFARLWASGHAKRNPCGRAKLYAGLLRQGVGRRVAEEALSNWSEQDEQEALERAAQRIGARQMESREKAFRKLAAKGFSLPSVRRLLDVPDA